MSALHFSFPLIQGEPEQWQAKTASHEFSIHPLSYTTCEGCRGGQSQSQPPMSERLQLQTLFSIRRIQWKHLCVSPETELLLFTSLHFFCLLSECCNVVFLHASLLISFFLQPAIWPFVNQPCLWRRCLRPLARVPVSVSATVVTELRSSQAEQGSWAVSESIKVRTETENVQLSNFFFLFDSTMTPQPVVAKIDGALFSFWENFIVKMFCFIVLTFRFGLQNNNSPGGLFLSTFAKCSLWEQLGFSPPHEIKGLVCWDSVIYKTHFPLCCECMLEVILPVIKVLSTMLSVEATNRRLHINVNTSRFQSE